MSRRKLRPSSSMEGEIPIKKPTVYKIFHLLRRNGKPKGVKPASSSFLRKGNSAKEGGACCRTGRAKRQDNVNLKIDHKARTRGKTLWSARKRGRRISTEKKKPNSPTRDPFPLHKKRSCLAELGAKGMRKKKLIRRNTKRYAMAREISISQQQTSGEEPETGHRGKKTILRLRWEGRPLHGQCLNGARASQHRGEGRERSGLTLIVGGTAAEKCRPPQREDVRGKWGEVLSVTIKRVASVGEKAYLGIWKR